MNQKRGRWGIILRQKGKIGVVKNGKWEAGIAAGAQKKVESYRKRGLLHGDFLQHGAENFPLSGNEVYILGEQVPGISEPIFLVRENVPRQPPFISATSTSPPRTTMSQGPSILVVDDSSAMRSLIAHQLTKEGFHVVTVSNSTDALSACKAAMPDLAIMDLELNGESGMDLIAAFQRDPVLIQVPIVACSGNTDDDIRQRALAAGAKRYLVKDETLRGEISSTIQRTLSVGCSAR